MKFSLVILTLNIALLTMACSENSTGAGNGEAGEQDAAATALDSGQSSGGDQCGGTEPPMDYTQGIAVMTDGGTWEVAIVASELTPPDRGDNTFTLDVRLNGASAPGLSVVAEPMMPQHKHGTVPTTFDAVTNDEGFYTVGPMDLFMPGTWELNFHVTEGETTETARFYFCLQG